MSVTAPEVVTVPAPRTVAEAIASLHDTSLNLNVAVARLVRLAELEQQTPEMRTVVINEANNGRYRTTDRAPWAAKSIGVINPGGVTVYVGIGGVSPTATARAFPCPGAAAVVLPVEAHDLEFGCDPTALGASTAVIFVFRYVTVQAPSLTAG